MTLRDPSQHPVSLQERLQKLDEIEAKVVQIMQSAGGTLEELSKDVPNQRQLEHHARTFRSAVWSVQSELISQLNFLSQVSSGLPFEKNVYKETIELTLAAERLQNSHEVGKEAKTSETKAFSFDLPAKQEDVESDPVVSSTVNEPESSFSESVSDKTETTDTPATKPHWRFSQPFVETVVHEVEKPKRVVSEHDFEIPEYEFDDEFPDLHADLDDDPFWDIQAEDDLFAEGRMTPDGLIDEDFERELGWFEKVLCIQEVIDADFRDISRLGIIQAGGSDHEDRKLVTFYACRLPPSDLIDHDRLLQYVTKTLDQYVTSDYTLVYFHWGLTNRNKPSFSWMVRAYQTLGRSFKKNLKSLIVVYPTRTVRVLWQLFSAFVSAKVKRKLHYVKNLRELEAYLPVCQLNLPLRIRDYDLKVGHLSEPMRIDPAASSMMGDHEVDDPPFINHQQFGVSLEFILANNGQRKIPIVVEDTIGYLRENGLDTMGLFIKPVHIMALRDAQCSYNRGEYVDLCEIHDPHLAAHLLKSFLAELREPLFTFELYDSFAKVASQPSTKRVQSIRHLITAHLPKANYDILYFIFLFLIEVLEHSNKNQVTAAALSVSLGPSLLRPRQVTPLTGKQQQLITAFTQICLTHFEMVFTQAS